MKKIFSAFIGTIFIFFFSFIFITPMIETLGYSSGDGSYHAVTHAILVSLIFTVIMCTIIIVEEFNKTK